VLVYSVCTLTREETGDIDAWLARTAPALQPLPPPGAPWQPAGRGALLVPQAADTDGMYVLSLRVPRED
jgi:16S rRNA C967 or C1407 C5-methylase (RsmB/RsmF family)